MTTNLEAAMKQTAFQALNKRYRVLAPASEAVVIYPEFDPCRAVMPIAIVEWPAIVGMKSVVLTHAIFEDDRITGSR